METKICSKCKERKPLEEFFKNERTPTGYTSYCKKCHLIAAKEWKEKNKERTKELRQNWNKANKEKVLEQNKKWRSNNNNREKANAKLRRGIENCSPCYIKSKLKKQGFIDSQITPEVIEEKRNIIKVKRIIKQIKTKQNYE